MKNRSHHIDIILEENVSKMHEIHMEDGSYFVTFFPFLTFDTTHRNESFFRERIPWQ